MAVFTKTYPVNIAETFAEYKYPKSFQRIQTLLDSKEMVTTLLKSLDTEIGKNVKKNEAEDGYTASQAMYDILRESEVANGFHKTEVKYLKGVLTPKMFGDMIRTKCAFLDPFVTNRHGAETHRVQWWMIMEDMTKNAGEYEKVDAGTLFASTLDKAARIEGKKTNNVWYHSLDADQGQCTSARAPESLKEYFASFKNIDAAEAGEMKWDTTIKMTWTAFKKLGKVKAKIDSNWEVKLLGT
jgi:hypothetical protein